MEGTAVVCSLCTGVLQDPVLPHQNCTVRSHFCRSCLESYVDKHGACPACKQNIFKKDLMEPEKTLLRMLPYTCRNCSWKGVEAGKTEHLEKCPQAQISCVYTRSGCRKSGPRQEIMIHESMCLFADETDPRYDSTGQWNRLDTRLASIEARLMQLEARQMRKETVGWSTTFYRVLFVAFVLCVLFFFDGSYQI